MHTLIKSCFAVVVAGVLFSFSHLGMAVESDNGKSKTEDDPVKKCQARCTSNKNNESYEACMLKCKETYKSTNPAPPK